MRGLNGAVAAAIAVVVLTAAAAVEAQVQHVVGGDRGWDPSSGVAAWSSGKTFRVGDRIWLAYSAVQGGVAEVRSREEFEACNVSNPIRMYTDGLDNIPLHAKGPRFFASTNLDHCINGLKLNLDVLPPTYPGAGGILQVTASEEHQTIIVDSVVAAGPTSPSASGRLAPTSVLLFASAFLGGVIVIGGY